MGAAFLLQYLSAELRRKCFSGGEVRKAPAKIIVLTLLPLHVFTNTMPSITAQLPFPCSHFKLLQITNGRRTLHKKKGPGDGD
jgi:hypothetical protein